MNKERRVFKKGRYVETRKGNYVTKLAKEIVNELKPLSKKIEIVGSIRRHNPDPVDIDLAVIPKNKKKIESVLKKKGKILEEGEKKSRFRINGVNIELYYTKPDSWGATLLAYSSKFGAGIGLRVIARTKGYKLNQYGLFNRKTKRKIAGKTEKEIYKALERPYKKPEDR